MKRNKYCFILCCYIICAGVPTSHVTTAGKFCLDDETSGTRVLEHVAPGVVSAIVGAADRAAHVSPQPRWTTRPGTPITAGHTARGTRAHLGQARLPVPAPNVATRRHL